MLPGLAELIAALRTESSPSASLERIAHSARSLTHSTDAVIAVLNESTGTFEVRSASPEGRPSPNLQDEDGILSEVAALGSPVYSGCGEGEAADSAPDPSRRTSGGMFESTLSELAAPVFNGNSRVRAVIGVGSDRPHAYGGAEREALQVLADLTALILQQELYLSHEEALIQIGRALGEVNEGALLDRVMRVAKDVLRLQACSVFLEDPVTDTFVLRGTVEWSADLVGRVSYRRGEGFTGWVADRGEPILLDDPQSDPRWRGKYVEIPSAEIASFLAVPILVRNRSIGAIRVLRRKTDNRFLDNRFSPEDKRLLEAIAQQLAAGLENSRNVETVIRNERMIAWGELSAKSSHMIGNRVFALRGDINELGHLLTEGKSSPDDLRDIQGSLATNLTRVEEILQDFRDFVSATQIDRRPTDLNALIEETVDEVFPKRSDVALRLVLKKGLPPADADPKRLRRAISELIENAINHMEAGVLSISTRQIGKGDAEPDLLEVEVADTGPGVQADQKALIFQPFFSKRVRGMGLGLSIVKGIVDAHGGEVYEAGQDGKGARFVIHLPAASPRGDEP